MQRVATAPLRAAFAHEVHDHRTHHVAGVTQEMFAVADVQAAGIGETQIGLVDQRGGIEQGVAAALAQTRARQPRSSS